MVSGPQSEIVYRLIVAKLWKDPFCGSTCPPSTRSQITDGGDGNSSCEPLVLAMYMTSVIWKRALRLGEFEAVSIELQRAGVLGDGSDNLVGRAVRYLSLDVEPDLYVCVY